MVARRKRANKNRYVDYNTVLYVQYIPLLVSHLPLYDVYECLFYAPVEPKIRHVFPPNYKDEHAMKKYEYCIRLLVTVPFLIL